MCSRGASTAQEEKEEESPHEEVEQDEESPPLLSASAKSCSPSFGSRAEIVVTSKSLSSQNCTSSFSIGKAYRNVTSLALSLTRMSTISDGFFGLATKILKT